MTAEGPPGPLRSLGGRDRRRRVERAVDVVHEMRRRGHPRVERVEVLPVDRDGEPAGCPGVEERDAPGRTTADDGRAEHVRVRYAHPARNGLRQPALDGRLPAATR